MQAQVSKVPACMRHRWEELQRSPTFCSPPPLLQVTTTAVLQVLEMICSQGTQAAAGLDFMPDTDFLGPQRYQLFVGVLSIISKHACNLMSLIEIAILERVHRL